MRIRELTFLMSALTSLAFPALSMLQRSSVVFYTRGDIINPATVYGIVINSFLTSCFRASSGGAYRSR